MILADLKKNMLVEGQDFNLFLYPSTTAIYIVLNADVRAELALKFKRITTKKVFCQMAGFHIIAIFKATIRSILVDKVERLSTLDLIEAEALKIERRLEEKQRTSTNGDETNRVLNTNQINQISNDSQQEDKVEAIGQRSFSSGRPQNSRGNGIECSFCNKPGHKVEYFWKEHG